ncbi:hypothetical protein HPB48_026239 [Haemaphysalis longicornis]|uniref:Uncharacterized protein n=1 Tax=Haemaphysalis longicornis TaxID=44386 RepID=A0A9J6H910_HAELO|nr:hypothetical protein HPB48_026239 [Haemaphysalis longicornis]
MYHFSCRTKDADLIPSQDLMRLIKHASPCAAVRKRQDIMDRDEYYNFMRMTNAEKHELLREVIHRQTTPSATSVTGLLHRTGRLRQDVRPPACMDHNRYGSTATNRNTTNICASTRKAAVAVEGNQCSGFQALSEDLRPPQRRKPSVPAVEHIPRRLRQREMRDHRRDEGLYFLHSASSCSIQPARVIAADGLPPKVRGCGYSDEPPATDHNAEDCASADDTWQQHSAGQTAAEPAPTSPLPALASPAAESRLQPRLHPTERQNPGLQPKLQARLQRTMKQHPRLHPRLHRSLATTCEGASRPS